MFFFCFDSLQSTLNQMNKDDIIKNISKQNEDLKLEVQYWKKEYQRMQRAYNQLLENRSRRSNHILQQTQKQEEDLIGIEIQDRSNTPIRDEDTYILDFDTPIMTTNPSSQGKASQIKISPKKQEKVQRSEQSPNKKISKKQDPFDFFSKDVHNLPPHLDKFTCELIEGCFIIQKNSSIDHFDPVRLIHPLNKYTKLRSMFDIIYRYIFVNDSLVQIHDDESDSRKNQLLFGTPCEDFQFVFDNLSGEKEGEKGRLNHFEKTSHLMRKRYAYGIVMPEMVEVGSQYFQTELAYGFLSHLPFPNFFKDLNRIVQQQIKYQMLNMNKNRVLKQQKIDLISEILKNITNKSLQKKLIVTDYPINLELKANICGLKLVYSNKNNYLSDQFYSIENLIHKFSLIKIIKIVHYVLTQHSLIIVCKNRRNLNLIFQIIRVIIYPFNWIFPIIYFYTPFFEPFLSSPLPILIGHLERSHQEEDQDRNSYKQLPIPENQLIKIYAQDEQAKDENDIQTFTKRIKRCYKKIQKVVEKHEKPLTSLIDKRPEQRVTNQLFQYIQKLRGFIVSGKTQEEVDEFLIQFMDTQMVSYYKETKKQLSSSAIK